MFLRWQYAKVSISRLYRDSHKDNTHKNVNLTSLNQRSYRYKSQVQILIIN